MCSQYFEFPASITIDTRDGSIFYSPTITAAGDKHNPSTSENNKAFPIVSHIQ